MPMYLLLISYRFLCHRLLSTHIRFDDDPDHDCHLVQQTTASRR